MISHIFFDIYQQIINKYGNVRICWPHLIYYTLGKKLLFFNIQHNNDTDMNPLINIVVINDFRSDQICKFIFVFDRSLVLSQMSPANTLPSVAKNKKKIDLIFASEDLFVFEY